MDFSFDRNDFCDIFEKVFTDEELMSFIDGTFKGKNPCTGFDYQTDNFKCFAMDGTYYIFNVSTGVCISWYKGLHLGRANECNMDIDLNHLKTMLEELKVELDQLEY